MDADRGASYAYHMGVLAYIGLIAYVLRTLGYLYTISVNANGNVYR